jgi:hypothetical protein
VADRFIRFCAQNGWKLSKAKRNKGGLDRLTDDEVQALEDVVGRAFESDNIQAASDSSAAVTDWRPETGTEKGSRDRF